MSDITKLIYLHSFQWNLAACVSYVPWLLQPAPLDRSFRGNRHTGRCWSKPKKAVVPDWCPGPVRRYNFPDGQNGCHWSHSSEDHHSPCTHLSKKKRREKLQYKTREVVKKDPLSLNFFLNRPTCFQMLGYSLGRSSQK